MKTHVPLLLLLVAVAAPQTGGAVEVAPGVKIGAHVRTRVVRHDGRDGDSSNKPVDYVENRVRLTLDAKVTDWFRAFVQLQDVRAWGEELNTLGDYSANGFDLHQGYGDIFWGDSGVVTRVGRQEIVIDGQRLVGAVGWTPNARSFDAARIWWTGMGGDLRLDGFYSHILDTESAFGANNTNTDFTLFSGVGVTYKAGKTKTSVWGLIDHALANERDRATITVHHKGKFGMFRYRVEGAYQLGSLDEGGETKDIGAWMAGIDAGVTIESAANLDIGLWFDILSGAEDVADTSTRTFDTLFATNHKFYGFSDYFLAIPAHTQGKGLMDIAVKASVKPLKNLKLMLHGHYLLPQQKRDGGDAFGTEIDFVAVWKPYKPIGVMLGVFTMVPGEALKNRLGGDDIDLGFYFQLQGDI